MMRAGSWARKERAWGVGGGGRGISSWRGSCWGRLGWVVSGGGWEGRKGWKVKEGGREAYDECFDGHGI